MVISELTEVETRVLRVLYDRDGEAAFDDAASTILIHTAALIGHVRGPRRMISTASSSVLPPAITPRPLQWCSVEGTVFLGLISALRWRICLLTSLNEISLSRTNRLENF